MKKTFAMLCFGIALALAPAAEAQRFEWAKGYSSWQEWNFIEGTVTDNEGNLYILGSFRNDAAWDGELLLPMVPYGPWPNNGNTIIAKISPDGEMLWKKVIHSNNGMSHDPQDIKKVGDSAFACMVRVGLPWEAHYTYYLDTLLRDTGYHDYPARIKYLMNNPIVNAFIVFDFDGNVKEQHILNLTYTDYNGEDIFDYNGYALDTTPWYCSGYFRNASFDIDGDGNIFISGGALGEAYSKTPESYRNTYDVQNGTIRGIKFWVDNRVVGYYPITGANPMKWYPQLVKFAPHFDTLLGCRYVIQGQSDSLEYALYKTTTKVDSSGNVYHISILGVDGYYMEDSLIVGQHENTLFMDLENEMSFYHTDHVGIKSFLMQYDSNLNPKWLLVLDDSVTNQSQAMSLSYFYDIDFDNDSNMVFLSLYSSRGAVGDTNHFYSIPMVEGVPLNIKNEAVVLSFKKTSGTPVLHSVSAVPSKTESEADSPSRGNLLCNKNRIFLQCKFLGGLRLPQNNIRFSNMYERSLGLVVFDYGGNVIGGIDYNVKAPYSRPGSISMQDSSLYLANLLVNCAADFGEIHVPARDNNVCIAKYVDTAFMTPYIRPVPTRIETIATESLSIFPNPAGDFIAVDVPGKIESATATTMWGIKIPLTVDGNKIGTGCLTPGAYILEIATENNKFNNKIIKR